MSAQFALLVRRSLLFGVVGCASVLCFALAQDDGLVGRWPLDEGAGTNTVDVSTNYLTGNLIGAPLPVWTSGISSNALEFDGSQNEVVIVDDPLLTPTNQLTLTAWVKTVPLATGEIIAKWSTNNVGGSYLLSLTNGCVALELSLGGEYVALVGGSTCLSDTNWHHIAGGFDGTALTVYFDGIVAGTAVASGRVDVVDAPLVFGFVPSVADEVRIYDRGLTANEVAALYNADLNGNGIPDRIEVNGAAGAIERGANSNTVFQTTSSYTSMTSSGPGCVEVTPGPDGVLWGPVFEGYTYTYTASGCIKFQSTEPGGAADPDGNISTNHCAVFFTTRTADSAFLDGCGNGLAAYSLVGKIDDGPCFQLGSDGTFTPPSSGCLKLYFNDDVWDDNSDSWECCITVSGSPTIPPCTPTISTASAIVFVNANDDDQDGTPDKYQWWWPADNESNWVAVDLDGGGAMGCLTATLSVTAASPAGHIRVWDKTDPWWPEMLIDNDWNTQYSWTTGDMPATVYVEGVGPSTAVNDVTLSLQLDCNATAATTNITVVDVTNVVWEATSLSALTNNADLGGVGGGLAIFPDRPTPASASDDYDRVNVKATIQPVMSGITVYFTSFDVDDPSATAAPVDNESGHQDNRGSPEAGSFPAGSTAVTDGSGIATVTFKTSMKPGDNYRVIAGPIGNFGSAFHALQDTSAGELTLAYDYWYIDDQYTTKMLTVWRHLWVERDTMAAADLDNESVVGNVVKSTITANKVWVNNLSGSSLEFGEDAYEGGRLIFILHDKNHHVIEEFSPRCIKKNIAVTSQTMAVEFCDELENPQIQNMKSAHHVHIKMWDDDYVTLEDNPQSGVIDGGESVRDAYRDAYVDVNYVDTGSQGNDTPQRPFIRKLSYLQLLFSLYQSRNITSAADKWASLVVSGFEQKASPLLGEDLDPDGNSGSLSGCNFSTNCVPYQDTDADSGGPGVGATPPFAANVSIMFLETTREADTIVGVTMAHEMGHSAGLDHYSIEPNLMHATSENQEANPHFRLVDIDYLRKKTNW